MLFEYNIKPAYLRLRGDKLAFVIIIQNRSLYLLKIDKKKPICREANRLSI